MKPVLGAHQTELGQEPYLYSLGKDVYSYDDVTNTCLTGWSKAGYAVDAPYSERSSTFLTW